MFKVLLFLAASLFFQGFRCDIAPVACCERPVSPVDAKKPLSENGWFGCRGGHGEPVSGVGYDGQFDNKLVAFFFFFQDFAVLNREFIGLTSGSDVAKFYMVRFGDNRPLTRKVGLTGVRDNNVFGWGAARVSNAKFEDKAAFPRVRSRFRPAGDLLIKIGSRFADAVDVQYINVRSGLSDAHFPSNFNGQFSSLPRTPSEPSGKGNKKKSDTAYDGLRKSVVISFVRKFSHAVFNRETFRHGGLVFFFFLLIWLPVSCYSWFLGFFGSTRGSRVIGWVSVVLCVGYMAAQT